MVDQEEAKRVSPIRIIFLILLRILLIVLLAAALLVAWLTFTEYRPADGELLPVQGSASKTLHAGDTITVMSWNVGYGALGDNADFFMDGGTMVKTADAERIAQNLTGILSYIDEVSPDLLILQEVDRDAARSCGINEETILSGALSDYQSTFATNYKAAFVPYPIPPLGRVDAGLLCFSAYPIRYAERLQLPIPFKWPVRIVNLKRCLDVNRIPIEDRNKALVLIDLHLEAYDRGEGKIAQTNRLREVLEQEAAGGNYVIAGGDFNQIFSSANDGTYAVRDGLWAPGVIDVGEFGDDWQFVMDSRVPSCRSLDQVYVGADTSDFQYYLIDGFIVSGNIRIESAETRNCGFVCTDHNPVVMTVTLE